MKTKENKETEVSWRAAEYEHEEKSGGWYIIVGLVTLILIALAIWQKNFFFGIFILLAGIMVVVQGNRKPNIVNFKLTEEGCELGHGVRYRYEELRNFSIRSRPHRLDEIVLRKKTYFNPFIKVLLDSRTAEKARIFLVQKLPEVKYETSLLDVLIDFLGF